MFLREIIDLESAIEALKEGSDREDFALQLSKIEKSEALLKVTEPVKKTEKKEKKISLSQEDEDKDGFISAREFTYKHDEL